MDTLFVKETDKERRNHAKQIALVMAFTFSHLKSESFFTPLCLSVVLTHRTVAASCASYHLVVCCWAVK